MAKIKQCDVCGKDVKIDNWGNGTCKNCGWGNDDNALKYLDAINPPNFVSLNEARNLYKHNKSFTPTFKRTLDLVKRGIDVVFNYKNILYQLSKHKDYTFWQVDTDNFQSYKTIEEFRDKINIDGVRVEDLWDKVKKVDFAD